MSYNVIPLTTDGEGHVRVNLGNTAVELVTRFNYTVGAWSLDILDAAGDTLIAGVMLFPWIDLLKPYPDLKALLTGLVLVENNPGDHQYPDLLGTQVQLLWGDPAAILAALSPYA